tara:strand:+ start:589 stop:711 length:123 start_codon:yes stop_codon:yes gene_type:complete
MNIENRPKIIPFFSRKMNLKVLFKINDKRREEDAGGILKV